jgi:hypothetical protein
MNPEHDNQDKKTKNRPFKKVTLFANPLLKNK